MTTTEAKTLKFERVTCGRCGGTGRYSYCQTMKGKYGPHTCFKCVGAGEHLTKRGSVASQLLARALSVKASELEPGMKIANPFGKGFVSVLEAKQENENDWSSRAHTDAGGYIYGFRVVVDLGREGQGSSNGPSDRLIRVAHSAEAKRPKLEMAIEYQECLTKTGRVRKDSVERVAEIVSEMISEPNTVDIDNYVSGINR